MHQLLLNTYDEVHRKKKKKMHWHPFTVHFLQGTFRLSCEHVLESLKKGRETLLTLLEAFVYDPLVDWAIGEDIAGGLAVTTTYGDALNCDLLQASKQLEREVTRDTLAIRFTEIKADWLQNRWVCVHIHYT